jgi:hypothetical protein
MEISLNKDGGIFPSNASRRPGIYFYPMGGLTHLISRLTYTISAATHMSKSWTTLPLGESLAAREFLDGTHEITAGNYLPFSNDYWSRIEFLGIQEAKVSWDATLPGKYFIHRRRKPITLCSVNQIVKRKRGLSFTAGEPDNTPLQFPLIPMERWLRPSKATAAHLNFFRGTLPENYMAVHFRGTDREADLFDLVLRTNEVLNNISGTIPTLFFCSDVDGAYEVFSQAIHRNFAIDVQQINQPIRLHSGEKNTHQLRAERYRETKGSEKAAFREVLEDLTILTFAEKTIFSVSGGGGPG